jgi:predicted nucleotide-binding protein (sugar kinase/HSP70/actin superfamily)
MGYSYVAFKMLINDLGYEAVVPPEPSKRTIDLGVRYAPEFACIPFKVLLGTYLETIEMGAEMAITSGGMGPCRAGYYGIMHQRILNELGHDFHIHIFEPPQVNYLDFIKKLKAIKPRGMSWRTFIQLIKKGYGKLEAIDEMEYLMYRIMPFEINKGDTANAFKKVLEILDEAQTAEEIEDARWECRKMIAKVPQDRSRVPLKIGIIGEIYVVLEPAVNFYLQKTLGEMGVYTDRSIWLTSYTQKNVLAETAKIKTGNYGFAGARGCYNQVFIVTPDLTLSTEFVQYLLLIGIRCNIKHVRRLCPLAVRSLCL